jgi:hypothetical protein
MGRDAYRVWWEKLRKGNNLEDSGVDARILSKWNFGK